MAQRRRSGHHRPALALLAAALLAAPAACETAAFHTLPLTCRFEPRSAPGGGAAAAAAGGSAKGLAAWGLAAAARRMLGGVSTEAAAGCPTSAVTTVDVTVLGGAAGPQARAHGAGVCG